jgi:hypothetical protein
VLQLQSRMPCAFPKSCGYLLGGLRFPPFLFAIPATEVSFSLVTADASQNGLWRAFPASQPKGILAAAWDIAAQPRGGSRSRVSPHGDAFALEIGACSPRET